MIRCRFDVRFPKELKSLWQPREKQNHLPARVYNRRSTCAQEKIDERRKSECDRLYKKRPGNVPSNEIERGQSNNAKRTFDPIKIESIFYDRIKAARYNKLDICPLVGKCFTHIRDLDAVRLFGGNTSVNDVVKLHTRGHLTTNLPIFKKRKHEIIAIDFLLRCKVDERLEQEEIKFRLEKIVDYLSCRGINLK